jgi:FkbM family methyltransferase
MLIYKDDVMLLRRACRNVLPPREKERVAGLLRRLLGSHWKALYFEDIDRTSLGAMSDGRRFDAGLKLAPFFISRPGAAFDIGANAGRYTYVLEKVVGPEHTYAIEPVPQLAARLTQLFPHSHVFNMALSDVEGTLDLKIPIVHGFPLWGRSSLEEFRRPEPGDSGTVVERVSVQTLDRLCETLGIQDVRFVKIDVEGHEFSVLRGAQQTLAKWRPVLLVEIEQRHHIEPVAQGFAWIQEQGYSGFFYDAAQMLLRPIEQFVIEVDQHPGHHQNAKYINNFFFVATSDARTVIDHVDRSIHKPNLN